jgi:thiol-disulfide isomerase/thioredoxin
MLASIALSVSMVAVAQADTTKPVAEDLIERHIEVTGGMPALAGIKGMHRVWELKSGDDTGTLESNWSPEAYRSTLSSTDGSWSMAWGQDASGAWQQAADGSMTKTDPAEALMLKFQADPGALLRRDEYLKRLAVTNEVQLSTGRAWRVLAAPNLGKVMTLFFDKATGRLVAAEYWRNGANGKRMHVEATYDDWRSKGPLHMAYGIKESSHLGDATLKLKELDIRQLKPQEVARLEAGSMPTVEPSEPAPPTAAHAKLISMLGDTVTTLDGSRVSSKFLAGKKNVLLYFSAKWCPPCRTFTPELVTFAKNNPNGDFAILLVSSDRKAADMGKYMTEYNMPFGAVDYAKSGPIKSAWAGGGIPNLVWLDADDNVIKGSYETNGAYSPKVRNSYIGPQKVLAAFKQR